MGRDLELDDAGKLPLKNNMWYGASVTNVKQLMRAATAFGNMPASVKTFLSIEPILEDITATEIWDDLCISHYMDWVIIGAETGHRKDKVAPKKIWIYSLIGQCRDNYIPIFMKESLRALYGDSLIQKFPEGLRRE